MGSEIAYIVSVVGVLCRILYIAAAPYNPRHRSNGIRTLQRFQIVHDKTAEEGMLPYACQHQSC